MKAKTIDCTAKHKQRQPAQAVELAKDDNLEVREAACRSVETSIQYVPKAMGAQILEPFVRKLLRQAASCSELPSELNQSAVIFSLVKQARNQMAASEPLLSSFSNFD